MWVGQRFLKFDLAHTTLCPKMCVEGFSIPLYPGCMRWEASVTNSRMWPRLALGLTPPL